MIANLSNNNEIMFHQTPRVMSEMDMIHEATGDAGVIFHYALCAFLIIMLIWIRYKIYVWDKSHKGKEFFKEFRKEKTELKGDEN